MSNARENWFVSFFVEWMQSIKILLLFVFVFHIYFQIVVCDQIDEKSEKNSMILVVVPLKKKKNFVFFDRKPKTTMVYLSM